MELNGQRNLVESFSNRSGPNVKKLTREVVAITKERDRMMHNAKAATWKLQEVSCVEKTTISAFEIEKC